MFAKYLICVFAFVTFVHCDNRFNFVFYHSAGISEYSTSGLQVILSHPLFDRNGQTVMFHYGADQALSTREVDEVVQAYRTKQAYNFIVVNYRDSSEIGTLSSSGLGDAIGDSLINLFNNGYNSGFMNLVGFSLGAQIFARASRRVQDRTSRRHIIGRLTGLDPWDLGPISSITVGSLSSADAQLVESIHTEGNSRGDHSSRGHLAFFLNGGINQPFCDSTLPSQRADCSHIFALTVWTESLRSARPVFPALNCGSWSLYLSGMCNDNEIAHIGRVSNNLMLRGSFFLRTNNGSPFSRDSPFP